MEKEAKRQKEEEVIQKEEAPKQGRQHTVSIALPGSILDNAQSPELRTYLAGQVIFVLQPLLSADTLKATFTIKQFILISYNLL